MHIPGPETKPTMSKLVYNQPVGIHWQIEQFCICTSSISRTLNIVWREKIVFYELKELNYTQGNMKE